MSKFIWVLYFPGMLFQLSMGLTTPILPTFIGEFESNIALIGLGVSSLIIGSTIFNLPAGIIAGKLNYKMTMFISVILMAILSFLTAFAESYQTFFLLRFFTGAISSVWGVAQLAYISKMVISNQRGKTVAAYGGSHRIGLFLGPILGGLIGVHFNLSMVFIIQSIIIGTILLIIIFGLKETINSNEKNSKYNIFSLQETFKENTKKFGLGGPTIISLQLLREGRKLLVPLLGTIIGLRVDQIGFIIGAAAILDALMFIPTGFMMDKFGRKIFSVPCLLILSLGFLLLPLAKTTGVFFAVVLLMGFGNGLGSGAVMILGTDFTPKKKSAEFLGIWKFIGDAGGASGPIIIGQLMNAFTFGISSASVALIGFFGGIWHLLMVPETLKKTDISHKLKDNIKDDI